jgi:trans-aconitate 2-methyltransferase
MWDPAVYHRFGAERSRPFADLAARIGADRPRAVVDLGCGSGELTLSLAERWPRARLTGIDSSPEMIEKAVAHGGPAWFQVGDVADWRPEPDADVLVTNAVLQWVPDHRELLARWAAELPAGAWIAMQVPGNFDAPSHALAREVARSWEGIKLRDESTVLEPSLYAEVLAEAGCLVDAWETTYVQRLTGPDAVLEWISGTALRPVKAALNERDWEAFTGELAPRLRAAYPTRADGTTWFPFRRVFVVARTPN